MFTAAVPYSSRAGCAAALYTSLSSLHASRFKSMTLPLYALPPNGLLTVFVG